MNFEYPYFLWLLALLPLIGFIYWYAATRKHKALTSLGDPELVKELVKDHKKNILPIRFVLLGLASALLIVAFAHPRIPAGAQQQQRNGVDVMIVLDVSKSMLARDFQPNRLERAKQVLSRIIDKLQNHRIGIVVFAGKSYIQMPLSSDHSAAKMYLSVSEPGAVPTQGTVIADALRMANSSFNTKEKKYKSMILVSDGEDHDVEAVDIAKSLANEGVVIHTIGVGTPAGATIFDDATQSEKTDKDGNTVVTKLNESGLQDMAKATGGTYHLITGSDQAVRTIVNQLNNMDQRAIRDDTLRNFSSIFQWPVLAAFFLLLIEFFMSDIKRRKQLKPSPVIKKAGLMMLFFIMAISAKAQQNKQAIAEGNDFFKQGNYPAAAGKYQEAIASNQNDAVAWFNLGNAYYKGRKQQDAIQAYEKAASLTKLPKEKSEAHYNKGVVYQNNNQLAECIEAYKAALRINPADDDARQNLQKALRQQQQQQQQQKDNEEKNKNDDQKNNSSMNRQDAEDKLKALMQEERKLQDKLRKTDAEAPERPEKDW